MERIRPARVNHKIDEIRRWTAEFHSYPQDSPPSATLRLCKSRGLKQTRPSANHEAPPRDSACDTILSSAVFHRESLSLHPLYVCEQHARPQELYVDPPSTEVGTLTGTFINRPPLMFSSLRSLILYLCFYGAQQSIEGHEESERASQLQTMLCFFLLPFEGFVVFVFFTV